MKKCLTTLILFFYATQSIAQDTVMLLSPLAKIQHIQNSDATFFSNYYLSKHPKSNNVDQLLKGFENAQKYFFVKSFSLARQYYEKVVAMADIDEWNLTQREVIYLSYLRLSELDSAQSAEWIKKAVVFSSELDHKKFSLSKNTQDKAKAVKNQIQKEHLIWDTTPFRDDFSTLLINGQTISTRKNKFIKIPSGQFRVTFLSDIYKPQTFIASSQQIPLITPIRIPFVSGNCEAPMVNNEGELPPDLKVIYPEYCIRTFTDNKWDTIENKTTLSVPNPPPSQIDITTPSPSQGTPQFYKKKWFWIALGAIATAGFISSQNKDTKKPTHESVSGF